jgi:hypothetical protein
MAKDISVLNESKVVWNLFSFVSQLFHVTSNFRGCHFPLNQTFEFYETDFMVLVSSLHGPPYEFHTWFLKFFVEHTWARARARAHTHTHTHTHTNMTPDFRYDHTERGTKRSPESHCPRVVHSIVAARPRLPVACCVWAHGRRRVGKPWEFSHGTAAVFSLVACKLLWHRLNTCNNITSCVTQWCHTASPISLLCFRASQSCEGFEKAKRQLEDAEGYSEIV